MSINRKANIEEIYEIVQQIVEQFHPQSVILFGSYAYREPGPESDVDLLVVMDTPLKEVDQAEKTTSVPSARRARTVTSCRGRNPAAIPSRS